MTAARQRVVAFTARDGFPCNLVHVQGDSRPTRGPVLLVHGAGVSADIFRAPVQANIVDCLLDRGYDVWLENWRASIVHPPNRWNLDQAAAHDHPAAVEAVREQTGAESIQAVIHCQGSTSFMMAAVAGLLPAVRTVVSNAVSLHPVVPAFSQFKNRFFEPIDERLMTYMDPTWGLHAPGLLPRALALLVLASHRECDSVTCRMVSFTYGSGHPALWRHENLNAETHGDWLDRNFGFVPLSFFAQIHRCVVEGHLVSVSGLPELPASFVAQPPRTDARFAFFAGELNQCFSPESQRRTFEFFDAWQPGRHAQHVIPGYSHLDLFMGERASRDVFPLMLKELEQD